MPPFSTDDYYKLLQKIAVLETKILRLEVNVEVNGQYGNETTLPMTQISGKEQANRQMLCAKPKHNSCKDKSLPSDVGRRLTGRTQHKETRDDTEWPALPYTGGSLQPQYQGENSRGMWLKQKHWRRYEAKLYTKRLQKELTTGPQTLIVGDGAVNKTKHFFSKNTKVLCFTNDMVSDISEKILEITAEHLITADDEITRAFDVVKQQSEVLKQDFNDLLNKVRCLNTEVFISGPLPTVRQGDERFSRLLMLNRWLKDTCATQSVNFIDNIFWERRHLFEADGFCLNKSGVQLLSYNIFDFLRQSPAAPAKDKRRDNPKQQIRQPSGEKLLPPEIRIDHEGQHTEREALTSSSLPQHKEFPPAPTAQHEESPPAPTTQQEESPPAPTAQQSGFSIPPFSGFPTHTTPKSHFFSPKSPSSSSPSHSTMLENTITQTSVGLYWPVAFLEALMTSVGGSHLKQGSRPAIFVAIIEDRVPSNARLFLVFVLFSPTSENTLSASAFKWGNTSTSLATAASLSNSLAPVTYGK
ncbi:hypothetical protein N1851_015398 [Merluccius polli]|uniref:Uncharacterized protein n=1 Tax=Merluccius polli TaxID=89951 RepID=A0AA47MSG5_MERPO|nr:hypothetical protein N1851_015398 [Merluccius polli]